ncbi:MAG: TPM domain-containing protein [Bacteroidota bacterium]|nr:TPM domain-containing protein [Bacteroidota bacterium]
MRRAGSAGVVILCVIFIATALLVNLVGDGCSTHEEIKLEPKLQRHASSELPNVTAQDAELRYRVEDVPNVQLQDASRFTSDPNHLIAERSRIAIDSIAAVIRDTFDVEVAVVVLPNFDDNQYATARDFGNQLFNTWGIGNKETDQGLLILLVLEEGNREIAFETGYGLEATLPDGICKRIQTKIMLPYLAEAEYGEALEEGLKAVQKVLADSSDEEIFGTTATSSSDDGDALLGFAIWTLFGLAFLGFNHFRRRAAVKKGENAYQKQIFYRRINPLSLIGYYIFFPYLIIPYALFFNIPWRRRLRKSLVCESCNSIGAMKREKGSKVVQIATSKADGIRRYTFTCKRCGHQHFEDIKIPYVPPYVSSGDSDYSSSSYDSSSSSSSSSGGSWGGGSSGGGGASTRF